jgi:hypothetical protein
MDGLRDEGRGVLLYGAAMVVVLAVLWMGGDNGLVYTVVLLGVPIVSGMLAGLGRIRFWHAVLGCLAVVVLDVVADDTRAEDAIFFVVLAIIMVVIAAVARWGTRWVARRRAGRPVAPQTDGQLS